LTLAGLLVARDTDPATVNVGAGPGGSGPATKTFVDAFIAVRGNGTKAAGAQHTFTITVKKDAGKENGFVNAPDGTKVTPSVVVSDITGFGVVSNTCSNPGTVAGKCSLTVLLPHAGRVQANASVTLSVGGVSLTRDTNPSTPTIGPGPGGTGPAQVVYVDGSIALSPDSATVEVGQTEVITVTVKRDAGQGAGLVNVPNGTKPVVTVTNSNGATSQVPSNKCATTGTVNGQCTISITTPTSGKITINEQVTFNVAGVSLTRDTDPSTASIPSGPSGSGPSVTTFVDASISVSPSVTNEVNVEQPVTVTVKQNPGTGGSANAPDGTKPTIVLTSSLGANAPVQSNTCSSSGTTTGQCTVTFTSNTAGKVNVDASVTLTVGGVLLTRDTNASTTNIPTGPDGSYTAQETFVDATIAVAPPNPSVAAGSPQTITVTVQRNAGDGVGLVNAADGTHPTITLIDSAGAVHQVSSNSCATTGTVSGGCSITFSSPSPGTVVVNASVTLTVGGVSMTRDTDPVTLPVAGPGGSGPATVTFFAT
jgi:hypothetical protein